MSHLGHAPSSSMLNSMMVMVLRCYVVRCWRKNTSTLYQAWNKWNRRIYCMVGPPCPNHYQPALVKRVTLTPPPLPLPRFRFVFPDIRPHADRGAPAGCRRGGACRAGCRLRHAGGLQRYRPGAPGGYLRRPCEAPLGHRRRHGHFPPLSTPPPPPPPPRAFRVSALSPLLSCGVMRPPLLKV